MASSDLERHARDIARLRRNERAWDEADLPDVLGRGDLRYWGDASPRNLKQIGLELIDQRGASGIEQVDALSISGGADYGAFGAGILNAWSKKGDRPEFAVVTGISTGALSAPFAYLGAEYDPVLREMYGKYGIGQIAVPRSPLKAFPTISLTDTAPLRGLISSYLDAATVAAIAQEHDRGRRLFVQTAHMDAQRPVIWDVGRIATLGTEDAVGLMTDVLLASASLPIAFPPVWIETEIGGEPVAEMHMDGGVFNQITFADAWQEDLQCDLSAAGQGLRSLRAILNGTPHPEGQHVGTNIASIASRALSSTFKIQFQHDLRFAAEIAERRGARLEFACVQEDFEVPYKGPFDKEFMTTLYEYGFELCCAGRAWKELHGGG